ncbi:hypothetical protein BDB01DRAFT_703923, partial [Pilobolus umbonatus]
DIYSIYKEIEAKKYQLHQNVQQSIILWLTKLSVESSFSVDLSPSFVETYSFSFMPSWQRDLLASAKEFCLDATHKTTNVEKCLLYTIVNRLPSS